MKKPKEVNTAFSSYHIQKQIGNGGNATVYSALDDSNSKVAIKFLDLPKPSSEKLKRFKNEYIFCSTCNHPNIIKVTDYGITPEKIPFFVMPLYDYSLRKLIGQIAPKECLKTFAKILDGIEAAHKLRVVHRDIKPENVLVNKNCAEIVIADFGIAEFLEEDLYTAVETRDDTRLANFQYAAPEQRSRGKTVDHRADIYALGLILNELFTHGLAYGTDYPTISAVDKDYSYLDGIVTKMLKNKPSNRYNEIDEIKKDLIARGEEFINLQKLNELRNKVIPTQELDDPIINEPMKIINVDWENYTLRIYFNHVINSDWISSIKNIGTHYSVPRKGPKEFIYKDNYAQIRTETDDVPQIVEYFKDWLNKANNKYKQTIKDRLAEQERLEREELQKQIRLSEKRENLLKNLKY